MIKFIKREWFKLSIVTISLVTSLYIINIVNEVNNEFKNVKNIILDKVDSSNIYTNNIEHHKLIQLENITNELKRFNDNYEKIK